MRRLFVNIKKHSLRKWHLPNTTDISIRKRSDVALAFLVGDRTSGPEQWFDSQETNQSVFEFLTKADRSSAFRAIGTLFDPNLTCFSEIATLPITASSCQEHSLRTLESRGIRFPVV